MAQLKNLSDTLALRREGVKKSSIMRNGLIHKYPAKC
jgi:hypothetical protein